ncbi:unannotated protein [freshwater metagenome]|uniref:Unannotated protein n=1 Tax=freshwater metagenome TaxID=449393 RepID=A0A6J6ALH5_9ZZZZ
MLLETRIERRIATHHQWRHELGDFVAYGIGIAQHSGGITNRSTSFDRRERDDLGNMVTAIFLSRVANHFVSVTGVEVHVDIGHRTTAWVQEALEQKVVFDWIEVGDSQRVGHRTPSGRTSPWSNSNVVISSVLDEIPNDEEVRRESHIGNDLEFVDQAFDDVVGNGLAPTLFGPFKREMT